jgi:predicted DNA-binding protein
VYFEQLEVMEMWPFSKRRPRGERDELPKQPEPAFDYTGFGINDVSIKLWLPEKMTAALDRLSVEHEVSRPDILRWMFFEHVYGRDVFAGLLEHTRLEVPKYSRKVGSEFQRTVPTARSIDLEYLGKSTEDFKLWLPTRLKAALQELADNYQRPLSDYLRSVLARHLFGEKFYLEWQQALAEINREAKAHEAETPVAPTSPAPGSRVAPDYPRWV